LAQVTLTYAYALFASNEKLWKIIMQIKPTVVTLNDFFDKVKHFLIVIVYLLGKQDYCDLSCMIGVSCNRIKLIFYWSFAKMCLGMLWKFVSLNLLNCRNYVSGDSVLY